MGQRLLPKVQRTAQLSSSVSDGHGAMLKPGRSEQDDSPMSGFEKHSVCRKCKFPSGFRFSCSNSKYVHNCGVEMESSKFFFFFSKNSKCLEQTHAAKHTYLLKTRKSRNWTGPCPCAASNGSFS
jgi:hypothetical protein